MYDFEAAMCELDPWPGEEVARRVVSEVCVVHGDDERGLHFHRRLLRFPDKAVVKWAAEALIEARHSEGVWLVLETLAELGPLPLWGSLGDDLMWVLKEAIQRGHKQMVIESLERFARLDEPFVAAEAIDALKWLGATIREN